MTKAFQRYQLVSQYDERFRKVGHAVIDMRKGGGTVCKGTRDECAAWIIQEQAEEASA